MLNPLAAAADTGAQVPAWVLFATAALAPVGVILAAAITPLAPDAVAIAPKRARGVQPLSDLPGLRTAALAAS